MDSPPDTPAQNKTEEPAGYSLLETGLLLIMALGLFLSGCLLFSSSVTRIGEILQRSNLLAHGAMLEGRISDKETFRHSSSGKRSRVSHTYFLSVEFSLPASTGRRSERIEVSEAVFDAWQTGQAVKVFHDKANRDSVAFEIPTVRHSPILISLGGLGAIILWLLAFLLVRSIVRSIRRTAGLTESGPA